MDEYELFHLKEARKKARQNSKEYCDQLLSIRESKKDSLKIKQKLLLKITLENQKIGRLTEKIGDMGDEIL